MCKHKVLLVIQVINSTSARREPTNEYTSQSNQGKLLTPTQGVSPLHATRTTISTEWIKVRVDLQRFFVVCVCWFLSPSMRSPLFGHKLRFMFARARNEWKRTTHFRVGRKIRDISSLQRQAALQPSVTGGHLTHSHNDSLRGGLVMMFALSMGNGNKCNNNRPASS